MKEIRLPRSWRKLSACAAIVGSSLVGGAQVAHATNGFFSHCIGAYSCGMAGAGVAMPMDASDSSHNPATMARLGNEVVISPAYFHPVRTMDLSRTNPAAGANTAAGKQTSQVEDFIEGAAGVNYKFTPDVAIGVSVHGSGGMMTEYHQSRTNRPAFGQSPGTDSEVRYRLAHLVPMIAWKPDDRQAYGAGLVLGYSDFKTDFATLPAFATTRGNMALDRAYGVGFQFGGVFDLTKQFSLGAVYNSTVWFQEFEKYKDVFLGPINTPWHATVGVAWHVTPQTDIAFDVKYIAWDSVKAIGTEPNLGGFGWESKPVFILGAQHRLEGPWTLRAGYSYGPSPIPDKNVFANALFPAIMEHHISAGASYRISPAFEITGAVFYSPKAEQTDPGTAPLFGPTGGGTKVDMYQYGAQLAVKYKF